MKVRYYTEGDMEKQFIRGVEASKKYILTILSLILQDKHGMKKDEILDIEKEIAETIHSIQSGNVTLKDIIEAKREEIGIIDDDMAI